MLSFSRAAVSAVRARLELREVAAANVRTFDSFAGQILLDADIEPIGSYEARIRQATRVLNESDEIPFEVESLRHVVMDEVQDLVGDRADFVLALLRRLDSDVGVTALGDPLQASTTSNAAIRRARPRRSRFSTLSHRSSMQGPWDSGRTTVHKEKIRRKLSNWATAFVC